MVATSRRNCPFSMFCKLANDAYLPTVGKFAGVSAWMPFRHVHSSLFIEVAPVVGNLACGVMERHGDGFEQTVAQLVDERKLHQFGAVDGFVVGQVEIVVWTAEIGAGMGNG